MYSMQAIGDPQRKELAHRIEMFVDPEMESAYPRHYGSKIEIEFADGRLLTSSLLDPHGMPADPCSQTERNEKFVRLSGNLFSTAKSNQIIECIERIEEKENINQLMSLLRV